MRRDDREFGGKGQVLWGALGGLTPYAVAGKFAAWFHGGSFPIMLNFLFGETFHQMGNPTPH